MNDKIPCAMCGRKIDAAGAIELPDGRMVDGALCEAVALGRVEVHTHVTVID